MGGRGRGRGMSFSVEALGFGRGDVLPPPILQPPPLYAPLESKPAPLVSGEVDKYILALKQELILTFKSYGFYLQPSLKKKDVERYSDQCQQRSTNKRILYDWTRLPKKLQPRQLKRKSDTATLSLKTKKFKKTVNIGQTLENLEQAEKNSNDDEKQEKEKKEDEEGNEPEEELEEEIEEETDYAFDYFDNGENYADEEEDNLDDGPTY